MAYVDKGISRLMPRAGERLGDFEIVRRIGAGGMGVVYLARQLSSERLVALKILSPIVTRDKTRRRFLREAQAVASLQHQNIVRVYTIHEDEELCYYAMEFIDGWPLSRVISRLANTKPPFAGITAILKASAVEDESDDSQEATTMALDARYSTVVIDSGTPGRLPALRRATDPHPSARDQAADSIVSDVWYLRQVVVMMRDVAAALAYAHANGIVHRDIKPDNLLLDHTGVLHMVDFGLARILDQQSITLSGELMGTPLYMSPEQVAAGRIGIDHRTDIYSLGVVMYHLLCLKPPFEAETREGLLRAIAMQPPQPLSGKNPAVPRPLETIVHKAMEKNPEKRYSTGTELAEDLDRWLAGNPILARRSTQLRRWWTAQSSRTRLGLLAAGGVAVCWMIMVMTSLTLLFSRVPSAQSTIPSPPDPTAATTRALEQAEMLDYVGSALWHTQAISRGAPIVGAPALARSLLLNQMPPLYHRFPLLGPGPRFDLSADGTTLLTCPTPNQVQIWSLLGKGPLTSAMQFGMFIKWCMMTPDGDSLIVLAAESTSDSLHLRQLGQKGSVYQPVSDLKNVRQLRYSLDGRTIAMLSEPPDDSIDPPHGEKQWNLSIYRFGESAGAVRIGSMKAGLPVEISGDGRYLAACTGPNRLELIDLQTQRSVGTAWQGWPQSLAFSSAGATLAVLDRQGRITLLNTADGRPADTQLEVQADQAGAYAGASEVRLCSDGTRLLALGPLRPEPPLARRMIGLWDLRTGRQVLTTTAQDGRLSGDGLRLVCWDEAGVSVFETDSGLLIRRIEAPVRGPLSIPVAVPKSESRVTGTTPVSFNKTADRLLIIESCRAENTSSSSAWASIWDVTTGERLWRLLSPLSGLPIATLDPKGGFALTLAESGASSSGLCVWDLRDTSRRCPPISVLPAQPLSWSHLRLGRRPFAAMLSRSADRYAYHLTDLRTMERIREPIPSERLPQVWLTGESIAIRLEVDNTGRAQLIDADRGLNIDTWSLNQPPTGVAAMAANGALVAIARRDGTIGIRRTVSAHSTAVVGDIGPLADPPTLMEIGNGNRLLALADQQGQIFVYDLATVPKLLRKLVTHRPIRKLLFALNDTMIVAGHDDTSVTFWSREDGRQVGLINASRRPGDDQPGVPAIVLALRDSSQAALLATAVGNRIQLWPLPAMQNAQTIEQLEPLGTPLETTHPVVNMVFTPVAGSGSRRPTDAGESSPDWLIAVTNQGVVRRFSLENPYRGANEWYRLVIDQTGMRLSDHGRPLFVPIDHWLTNRQAVERNRFE